MASRRGNRRSILHQHSFRWSDSLMVAGFFWGAYNIYRGRRIGCDWSLLTGGGLVFLGLADISFNALNGSYTKSVLNFVFTMVQNLWCLGVGAYIFAKCRRRP